MTTMFRFHVEVSVDEQAWAEEYGVPADDVSEDLRSWIVGALDDNDAIQSVGVAPA
jgi:hypothetical protein